MIINEAYLGLIDIMVANICHSFTRKMAPKTILCIVIEEISLIVFFYQDVAEWRLLALQNVGLSVLEQ